MKIIGHIRLLAMLILAIPILIVTYRKHNGNVMVERNPPLEMQTQGKPTMPATTYPPSPKISAAERPLSKTNVPKTDISAYDEIADFADGKGPMRVFLFIRKYFLLLALLGVVLAYVFLIVYAGYHQSKKSYYLTHLTSEEKIQRVSKALEAVGTGDLLLEVDAVLSVCPLTCRCHQCRIIY